MGELPPHIRNRMQAALAGKQDSSAAPQDEKLCQAEPRSAGQHAAAMAASGSSGEGATPATVTLDTSELCNADSAAVEAVSPQMPICCTCGVAPVQHVIRRASKRCRSQEGPSARF